MHRITEQRTTGLRLRAAPLLAAMAVLAAGLLAGGTASAQVIRCTDAKTGRITYTNSSCGNGETSVQVQAAPSPEELARDKAQAAQAIERKQEQMAREQAERNARAQQQEREARERNQARQGQGDNGDSPACQQAKRRLDAILAEANPDLATWGTRSQAAQQQMEMACLGAKAYEQLQQTRALQPNAINRPWVVPPRPIRPQPSAPISHCNVFRCYDTNGGAHPIP